MNQSDNFRELFDDFIHCSAEEVGAYENDMASCTNSLIQAKEAIVAFVNPFANEQQMANIKLLVDEIDYLVGASALTTRADGLVDEYNVNTEIRSDDAQHTLLYYVDSLIDNYPEVDDIWDDYKARHPNEAGNMRRHLK